MFLYADDAKIFRYITDHNCCLDLQGDLDRLNSWADESLLKLNVSKCKVVSYGRNIDHNYEYNIAGIPLQRLDNFKDLGVTFDSKLKFYNHIDEKINKAYQTLGIIKRNFIYVPADCFILLYKSLVRSHLEYANCVWNPYHIELSLNKN
jgi:hypothetical protein